MFSITVMCGTGFGGCNRRLVRPPSTRGARDGLWAFPIVSLPIGGMTTRIATPPVTPGLGCLRLALGDREDSGADDLGCVGALAKTETEDGRRQ